MTYENYEIIKLVNVNKGIIHYFWRHIPKTKPITRKQRKWLDDQIALLNDNARYEI